MKELANAIKDLRRHDDDAMGKLAEAIKHSGTQQSNPEMARLATAIEQSKHGNDSVAVRELADAIKDLRAHDQSGIDKLGDMVKALVDLQTAPRTFMRDANNKIIGAKIDPPPKPLPTKVIDNPDGSTTVGL